MVLLYAPSHRQDNTYHGFCYTSRGALAGTRNSSMVSPHEGSIRRPTAPWANALPLSYVPLPGNLETTQHLLGPIWATFRPTKFKFHYVASQFFIFRRTAQIAPNVLHWNAHIFLFGLILRDIPNSKTPQTTLRLLAIPVGLPVLPYTRH